MNQKASVSVRVLCAATGFLSLYGIVFLERGVSQQDPAERVERRQQSGASAGSAHAPGHGQDWLNSLPQSLSHKTHLRARAFLSGVFTVALQSNVITGVNPMSSTKAGGMSKGRKAGDLTARELKIRVSNGHAYDHAEIALMLELPEPARTICAVAAFTGLSRSEIPALKWEDYKDGEISVVRKKWRDISENRRQRRERPQSR